MSFTAEVKDELARVPPTCSHCEKATLAALVRIENKTYGIDRITGELIPKERLRVVPHATLNVDSKKK